jgi:hypothetical protein
MDTLAQLALMTKAKLVFETPDTFLTFPALIPISYTPDQMKFADAASNDEMRVFSDFSRWTNVLPQGTLFQPALDDPALWDVYQGLLANAQVAQGSLTAQQTADLQSAQAFLSVQGAGGMPVDSPAVLAYKQYQQAWFAATQSYNNQKITASTSTDSNVKAAWQSNEPIERAKVQAAETDWETKGFKAQVEQAQSIEQTCAAQSPRIKWQSWRALCDPQIDFMTDPNNATFAPTVFAPFDIFEHGGWPSFSIAGSDIPNLVNQAPVELRNIFGTTSGSSTIDSLSFEYCSVALSRPWCRPEVFSSRFWRFSDSTVVSDGSVPPHGEWPAYIVAVVFARNIVETTRSAGAVQPQPLKSFPTLQLQQVQVAPKPAPKPIPVVLRAPVPAARPGVGTGSKNLMQAFAISAGPIAMATARPQLATSVASNPALRARLTAATFASAAPPTPPPSQPQSSGTAISILAFICKRLPKCPNPDPSLNWG